MAGEPEIVLRARGGKAMHVDDCQTGEMHVMHVDIQIPTPVYGHFRICCMPTCVPSTRSMAALRGMVMKERCYSSHTGRRMY